jgi:hypothetical protein
MPLTKGCLSLTKLRENVMHTHDIWNMLTRLGRTIVEIARGPEFTCGDCERHARCGLPPSKLCVVRAAQIERDGGRPVRRRTVIGF